MKRKLANGTYRDLGPGGGHPRGYRFGSGGGRMRPSAKTDNGGKQRRGSK